jgi:hypothetical protein
MQVLHNGIPYFVPALAADHVVTFPHTEARGYVSGEVAVPLLVPSFNQPAVHFMSMTENIPHNVNQIMPHWC